MTRDEAVKILTILKSAYPQSFKGMGREDAENTISLWEMMFDEPFQLVSVAVKAFIASDSKGFSPSIGQIKEKIRTVTVKAEMTELEAWAYVAKALQNSTYGSEEEFKKLPEIVQRVVGEPSQLREWAGMDVQTVQSVVASNFQRSFRARAATEREFLALPADVRGMIGRLTGAMPEMPKLEAPESQRAALIQSVRNYE